MVEHQRLLVLLRPTFPGAFGHQELNAMAVPQEAAFN
jgi:hypothetical protein